MAKRVALSGPYDLPPGPTRGDCSLQNLRLECSGTRGRRIMQHKPRAILLLLMLLGMLLTTPARVSLIVVIDRTAFDAAVGNYSC
jgi:hypothetical protein